MCRAEQIERFVPQDFANIAWSFAKAIYVKVPVLLALCSRAAGGIREFNHQDLANMAWAMANLLLRNEKLMGAIAEHAEERQDMDGYGRILQDGCQNDLSMNRWDVDIFWNINLDKLRSMYTHTHHHTPIIHIIDLIVALFKWALQHSPSGALAGSASSREQIFQALPGRLQRCTSSMRCHGAPHGGSSHLVSG